MANGLMVMGCAYLVRIAVLRQLGVEAAGFYQAAWALGGLYVGFILQAMGADFYPRLTAVANNNEECNRLVNEQALVGLLLAGPGVIGTLAIAPLALQLLYSSEFGKAVELLRWLCLGMMLRVATWPMGFIIVARGERRIFFWSELAGNLLQVSLIWASLKVFGLSGAGIGFFSMFLIYSFGIYLIVRRLSGFRWSSENRDLALMLAPLVVAVFVSWYLLPRVGAVILGVVITVLVGLYSIKKLCVLVPLDRLPQVAQKTLLLLRVINMKPPS